VAPVTYYANKARPPSARACRDAVIGPALRELWEDNYRVYGARKLWKAARRAGHDVGRDQVAGTCGPPASPELAAASGSAPPNPTPPRRGIPIWWAGISPRPRPISCG
jgi:putative transposase